MTGGKGGWNKNYRARNDKKPQSQGRRHEGSKCSVKMELKIVFLYTKIFEIIANFSLYAYSMIIVTVPPNYS